MVIIKKDSEIQIMKEAGKIAQNALKLAGEAVSPGVSTMQIDKIVSDYIKKMGATPSFLGYGGFPASACISVSMTFEKLSINNCIHRLVQVHTTATVISIAFCKFGIPNFS